MRTFLIIVFLIALLVIVPSSVYVVDRAEYVYLTRFGRHLHTYDGESEAGLYFKWPWPVDAVQRIDHRLQVFDLPSAELLTRDPKGQTIDKTLTIDAYVTWRVADKAGVDRFIRTVGTLDRARTILEQRVGSQLGAAIGQMELDDLFSTDAGKVDRNRDQLRGRLLGERDGLQKRAEEDYGIAIVDIRLRRANYPPQVRDAIAERIRSERNKKVAEYQSEGAKLAEDIKSRAESEARKTLADARAEEQRLKKQADTRADEIRNQAHAKDPQFFAFLQKLEMYHKVLGETRDMLLLSSKHELFDLLLKPPKYNAAPGNGNPTGGAMTPRPPAKTGG